MNNVMKFIFQNKLRIFILNIFFSFVLTALLMPLCFKPDGGMNENKNILGWFVMPGLFIGIFLGWNPVAMYCGEFTFLFLVNYFLLKVIKRFVNFG